MAQLVDLSLPGDVVRYPARILYVLVPMQDLPDRLRLGSGRIPHVYGKDQRIPARIVFENDLRRGIGKDTPVPIKLALDANCRERGWQRARRHHVVRRDLRLAAVEIAHRACAHMRGADREARLATNDEREIDEVGQRLLQRFGLVESGLLCSKVKVRAEKRSRVRLEKSRDSAEHGRPIADGIVNSGPGRETPKLLAFHPPPELFQPVQAVSRLVAGNEAGVNRADRSPDDPVGLDARLMERLIDAGLIGAKGAAALKDENDLARPLRRVCRVDRWSCYGRSAQPIKHGITFAGFKELSEAFSAQSSRRQPAAHP